MQSKNKPAPTKAEKEHIERIKSMPCVVCDRSGPSDCHEIRQGDWWTSMPLCRDCHTGDQNGIHRRKAIWKVKHWDELDALNETYRRIFSD